MGVGGWAFWGFGRGSFCLVVFSLIGDMHWDRGVYCGYQEVAAFGGFVFEDITS